MGSTSVGYGQVRSASVTASSAPAPANWNTQPAARDIARYCTRPASRLAATEADATAAIMTRM